MAEIIKNEEIEEKVILVAVSENDGDDAEDSVALFYIIRNLICIEFIRRFMWAQEKWMR